MDVGRNIRKYRKTKGFTFKQLSEASGVSIGMLSDIENRGVSPSLKCLAKVSKGLGVSVDYLIKE